MPHLIFRVTTDGAPPAEVHMRDIGLICLTALLCHLIGDYLLQPDGVAKHKTSNSWACAYHVLLYSIPFWLLLPWTWTMMAVILGTHFFIDRFRLAKYISYAKYWFDWPFTEYRSAIHVSDVYEIDSNGSKKIRLIEDPPFVGFMHPPPWSECQGTGYHNSKPDYMAVWLLIIGDNILHLVINHYSIIYLSQFP